MDNPDILLSYQQSVISKIERKSLFAEADGTVFFGDSLIEFWNLELFESPKLYNCGVRGATAYQLMYLIESCITRYDPKNVIILVGNNDLSDENQADKVESAFSLFKAIEVMLMKNKGIKQVAVISPLPIDEARAKGNWKDNVQLKLLGDEYRKICEDLDNVRYIDCFDSLIKDGQLCLDYTTDGEHLNDLGYERMTQLIKPVFQEMLKDEN